MRTRMQQLPKPALAGGVALLGGVAVWQLGIELERAWLRSYEGPLLGETPAGEGTQVSRGADAGAARAAVDRGRHRWVAGSRPRVAPRAPSMKR
jgi:hypothetical protein